MFVGYDPLLADHIADRELTSDELDDDGAVGLFLNDVSLGLLVMRSTVSPTTPGLSKLGVARLRFLALALKTPEDSVSGLVGVDELEVSVRGVSVVLNRGSALVAPPTPPGAPGYPADAALRLAVDFKSSFPATGGFQVPVDTPDIVAPIEPRKFVLLDESRRVISASANNLTVRIADYVAVTGSFAFELVETSTPVDVLTGFEGATAELALGAAQAALGPLPTAASKPAASAGPTLKSDGSVLWNLPVTTMSIGIGDADVFVGYDPLLADHIADRELTSDELDDDGAVGLFLNDVSLGLLVMRSTVSPTTPGLSKLGVARLRFLALALKTPEDSVSGLVGLTSSRFRCAGCRLF